MTDPDVAAIVEGLSEAQRRALTSATKWKTALLGNQHFGEMTPCGCTDSEILAMKALGLFEAPIRIGDRSSTLEYRINWRPAGLVVRDHIIRSERDA